VISRADLETVTQREMTHLLGIDLRMPSMYTAGKCRKGWYIGYADILGYALRRMI
jgi:hypothetical protein